MTFKVPEFKLRIKDVPVTNKYILSCVDEALKDYKSETLSEFDITQFGTFKLRIERLKFFKKLLKVVKPKYTMELGSGSTTLLFSKYVENKHVSFEHLEWCHERTCSALLDYNLQDKATVFRRDIDDIKCMYHFDDSDIPNKVDMLLIDGPPVSPKVKGRPKWERFNTLPFLMKFLSENCIVLLDSAERTYEQECLEKWCNDLGISFMNPGDDNSKLKGFCIIDPHNKK